MSEIPKFDEEQLAFLAVLKAFGEPVPAEVAGMLAPLTPGPLLDLIERGKKGQIIELADGNVFSLRDDLPETLDNRLERLLTPTRVAAWVEKMNKKRGGGEIKPLTMVRLLERCGRLKEASALEMDLCRQALEADHPDRALTHLTQALKRLGRARLDLESKSLFVSGALDHSNLCFILWQGLTEIPEFLEKAHELAAELGDQRSHALINLHLGRLFFYTDRRTDALVALATGFEEVEALGDDDIRSQSAFFFGLYYMIQGRHREAVAHFEKAEQQFLFVEPKRHTSLNAPTLLAYSLSYIGQFHRAIGSLESNLRLAVERRDRTLASTLQAALGSILVVLGKKKEGLLHLKQAEQESREIHNAFGRYLAGGAIGYQYFLDGRVDKAYEMAKRNLLMAKEAGIIRQFTSPWVLEQTHEFQRLGFESFPEFDYDEVFAGILAGPNVHLEGVALRLIAREMMARGKDRALIRNHLTRSEEALTRAGDPLQLSKTILEMARLALMEGHRGQAAALAQRAWRELGEYRDRFFPDEFRDLIVMKSFGNDPESKREETFKGYLQMLDALFPLDEERDVLARMVKATNRFFGAERGGLFWSSGDRKKDLPELRAACNLTRTEVASTDFRPNLEIILTCIKENRPIVVRAEGGVAAGPAKDFRAILCIPIHSDGAVRGVLYHDNHYLNDAFESLDRDLMMEMARHMNLFLERILAYLRLRDQAAIRDSVESIQAVQSAREPMVAESPVMRDLLSRADRAARTDSSILILGETGTGKELLAARIQRNSARSVKPLIVVDAAAVPAGLVESELFGHEKGAFTGADQRRIGRLEMAHLGTLFLDEIGELSLELQAKLLRVLQEKTFYRVGGGRVMHSDFRLIAATNRNLAAEVAAGHFREDLFYRLNVIPLELPALRERGEDILRLAEHFLEVFGKKHRKTFHRLTLAQKNELRKYPWPGNIRELQNLIERSVILSAQDSFELSLPAAPAAKTSHPFQDHPTMDELQRRYIKHVLELTGGKIGGPDGAAAILGMKRTGLYARMRKLGM